MIYDSLKELGVAEFIDERSPIVSMILNGLGFVSRTLHMVTDYFAKKPVERLISTLANYDAKAN